MRKLFSNGLAMVAGLVSVPGVTSSHAHVVPKAEYRTDPRLQSLKNFFEKAACPAVKYVRAFLEVSDRYHLDWRLLPSISFVESTGGKLAINNNWFGWDSGRTDFQSASAGIYQVGYQLTHSPLYRNKTTDGILATYNPSAEYAAKVKAVMRLIAPRT